AIRTLVALVGLPFGLREPNQADEELLRDRPAVSGNRDCAPATGPFQRSRRLASRAACDRLLVDVGRGELRLDQEGRPSKSTPRAVARWPSGSVPRAVASEPQSIDVLIEARSLPLAVLTRAPACAERKKIARR